MSVTFVNATILLDGYDLSGQHNQVAMDYFAESLDESVFGVSTRKHKGGLRDARLSGGGFWEAGVGKVNQVIYDNIGLDDAVVAVFPDGISEGSTSSGFGYAFKATKMRYTFGGQIGALLPFTFEAEGRGVQA